MTDSIRFTDTEKELIRKKSIEINRLLMDKGKKPLQDSKIIHILIEQGIELLEVSSSGEVKILK